MNEHILLLAHGGLSIILETWGFPSRSLGSDHTEVRDVTLKKNDRSSVVHTTDQGLPGMGTFDLGRGPLGSSFCSTSATSVWNRAVEDESQSYVIVYNHIATN